MSKKNCFLEVYNASNIEFVKGDKCYLYDSFGKKYIDFFATYAVNSLGHNHKILKNAIQEQMKSGIVLTSGNSYYCRTKIDLATLLCNLTFGDKVFFNNSGAESVELAVKVAKKYFNDNKKDAAIMPEIIAFKEAFHGRTNGAIALSDLPKLAPGFEPLLMKAHFAEFNNIDSVCDIINANKGKICGIIIEPVQGQGGLKIANKDFMLKLREVCSKNDIALILDEVQTGNSRTGKLYSYQHYSIEPDIMATAKGLGGGFPISACVINEKFAKCMTVGTHGTTFGGGPFATRVGLAVLKEISKPEFTKNVENNGKFFLKELQKIQKKHSNIIEKVDGLGLMIGMWLNKKYNNDSMIEKLLQEGLIATTANGNMVRFLPPLVISKKTIKEGLLLLEKALQKLE